MAVVQNRQVETVAGRYCQEAVRRLEYINLATTLEDLKVPPSNRLHSLAGDRAGQHAIAINDQWRVCFTRKDGEAFDVEITDYH